MTPTLRVQTQRWLSPPVEDNAGDDEHCRHRQHLRERLRGRPLGGFLHACLPRPGRDSSLRETRIRQSSFYSEHPATSIRLIESPLSEHRRANVEQHCGGILTRLCCSLVRRRILSYGTRHSTKPA